MQEKMRREEVKYLESKILDSCKTTNQVLDIKSLMGEENPKVTKQTLTLRDKLDRKEMLKMNKRAVRAAAKRIKDLSQGKL